MYHISKACFDTLFSPSRRLTARAVITTAAGNTLRLTASDFKQGGIRLIEATSGSGGFDLGAAVMGKLILTLNNSDGRFSAVNFIGGTVNSVQIGVALPDDSTEWIPLGIFDINSVKYSGTAAELVAYDLLGRADRTLPPVTCPVALGNLMRTLCTYCGIPWNGDGFLHNGYAVEALPKQATCRDVIAYAAAIAGCYAKMNREGELIFSWYGYHMPFRDEEASLDGGIFLDAASGDDCDGGDFFYYDDDVIDGGRNDFRGLCAISRPKSVEGDKPLTVTGIQFTEPDSEQSTLDENGSEVIATVPGIAYIYGADEYAFDLSENPLLTHDIQDVLENLGKKLIGESFSPVTVKCASNPAFEAGDIVTVSDRRGNLYRAYVNRCEYKFGSAQTLSCEAFTAAENASAHYSAVSRLEGRMKNNTDKKINAYGIRMQALNNLMLHSMGVYKTAVQSDNGSVAYYTHDKPRLEDSSYISCEMSNGFAYTNSGWNNGTPDWKYGMTADGNLICNVLSAVGIVADWIQAGRLESSDGSCYFDLDNNQLFANKIGLPKRYLSSGEVTTDSGESRAGIACYDEDLSDNAYFQIRPVQAASDGSLYGFGLFDQLGRARIFCSAREDNPSNNTVSLYGYDALGNRCELLAASALNGGVRISGVSGQNHIAVTDSGVNIHIGSKAVIEAGAGYTCIRNAGSNADYWISLTDSGVSICRGDTVLQQWS